MSGIIRKKQSGEAWETVADTGGGGSLPDPITETVNIDVAAPADVSLHIGDHASGSVPSTVEILGFDGQGVDKDLLFVSNFDEDGFTRVDVDGSLSISGTGGKGLQVDVAEASAGALTFAVGGDTILRAGTQNSALELHSAAADDVVLQLGRATGQTASIIAYDGDGSWYLNPDGSVDMFEQNDPTAPAANVARIFIRDNGGGKTQLCVLFNTGAVQVIATQP